MVTDTLLCWFVQIIVPLLKVLVRMHREHVLHRQALLCSLTVVCKHVHLVYTSLLLKTLDVLHL